MSRSLFHVVFIFLLGLSAVQSPGQTTLLNVSYDPTRELFADLNQQFIQQQKQSAGLDVKVQQSHGGSGKQARSVIDGLEADVVSLALAWDIDAIAGRAGLLPADWQARSPANSCPYVSTVVLVVRKGNPHQIRDWPDLARPGVEVITPNPKTSGGARWNYLAAWGYALQANQNDAARAREFVSAIYRNVPVLDTGARGSTTTFAQRGIGDVLITWESEAHIVLKEFGADQYEIINPPTSILAEPPVAMLDANVDKHGTRAIADAYLKFLYTPAAQETIARHHYRPTDPEIFKQVTDQFPSIKMFTLAELFGNWAEVQKTHFDDGGIFDQIQEQL